MRAETWCGVLWRFAALVMCTARLKARSWPRLVQLQQRGPRPHDSLGLNWTRHVITVTLPHALSANECQRRAVPYYGSPAPSSSLPSDQTNSSPAAQPKPRPSPLHLVRSLSMDLPHLPNPKFLLVRLCRHLQHQKPIGLDHMMFRLLHSNSRRRVLRGLLHHCP